MFIFYFNLYLLFNKSFNYKPNFIIKHFLFSVYKIYNMKLKAGHLFLILLLSLVFCCGLGGIKGLVEGMDNNNSTHSNSNGNTNGDKTVTTSDGRTITATHQNTVLGIPKSQIPPGQEDLYILKTQIVTPVCPVTPASSASSASSNVESMSNGAEIYTDTSKCPPCPPCGRCPNTSSFECVKKPVYKPDNPYLPVPVLTSFSSFGM
jgi:hypothetical protein